MCLLTLKGPKIEGSPSRVSANRPSVYPLRACRLAHSDAVLFERLRINLYVNIVRCSISPKTGVDLLKSVWRLFTARCGADDSETGQSPESETHFELRAAACSLLKPEYRVSLCITDWLLGSGRQPITARGIECRLQRQARAVVADDSLCLRCLSTDVICWFMSSGLRASPPVNVHRVRK